MFNQIIALALILLLAPFAKAGSVLAPLLAINLPGGNNSVTPPPQPVAVNVKIKIGESVKIPLTIYGQANGDVSFLIRSQPRHGALSQIHTDENGGSYVIYKHGGNVGDTADRFFYAARSTNGVSAAAPVEIAISDDAPQFSAPETLDFGSVLVGETVTRTLEISNSGGGRINGELAVDAPWQIVGDTRYSLARKGGTRTVTLRVTPDHPGVLRQDLRYSNDPLHPTELRISATPIFSAPDAVVLTATGSDPSIRAASLKIANATAQPLVIQISAPAIFQMPAHIVVPANSSSAFPLTAKGLAAIDDQLSLTANGYTQTVAIRADAQPANLQASAAALDFGTATINEQKSATLTLKNSGGAPADITLGTDAPFAVADADAHFQIAGGDSREIAISGSSSQPGEFHALLKIHTATQDLQISLTAIVSDIASAPIVAHATTPVAVKPAQPEPSREVANSEPLADNTTQATAGVIANPLPISNFRILKVTSDGCVLIWKPPVKSEPLSYVVESGAGSVNADGNFSLDWRALSGATLEKQSGEMIATVRGLQPKTAYVLRVTGSNSTTSVSQSSPEVIIHTAPSWTPLSLFTPLRALILALIILGTIVICQKMRERSSW